VRRTELKRLFGIQRGVNAAEDDGRAPASRFAADRISPQCVERVNTDTHNVAGRDA
jgi:hypothetical protein